MKHRERLRAFMLPRDMQRNDRLLRHILSPSICCRRAYIVADDNVVDVHGTYCRQSSEQNNKLRDDDEDDDIMMIIIFIYF